jgi:hypothetical protein
VQYTTALAGAGLKVTAASPNRTLAATPVTVTDLIDERFPGLMIFLLALINRST